MVLGSQAIVCRLTELRMSIINFLKVQAKLEVEKF